MLSWVLKINLNLFTILFTGFFKSVELHFLCEHIQSPRGVNMLAAGGTQFRLPIFVFTARTSSAGAKLAGNGVL